MARVAGSLTVNGGATFDNQCALSTTQGLANQSTSATNDGLVEVGGQFSNNGTWLQSATGTSRTGSLSNDGRVNGLGRYIVSTTSQTQNQFVGSSPEEPIVVDDQTPPAPPQIFDVQSGTVQNVVAGTVRAEPPATYPAPNCSGVVPRPSADVIATKSAPPTVAAGGQLQFTITVTNNGPSQADDVVVTDTLPRDPHVRHGFRPRRGLGQHRHVGPRQPGERCLGRAHRDRHGTVHRHPPQPGLLDRGHP